jgi:hypothetical protein
MISQNLVAALQRDILKTVIFKKEHTIAENRTTNDLNLKRRWIYFYMVVIFYLEIRFLKCKQLTPDNRKIGAST